MCIFLIFILFIILSNNNKKKIINIKAEDNNIESINKINTDYKFYSITNIIDGDTINIDIDGVETTIRMIGINTLEESTPKKEFKCFGENASKKATELLYGKKVRIENDSTQGNFDTFGRTLAYVYREDGLFYNKEMIKIGYAFEYTSEKPYKYQLDFKELQKSAQINLIGLWSQNLCSIK